MSMAVDLSTPLTKEERSYLAMRGRYSEIERADSLTDTEPESFDEGDGTGPKQLPLGTAEFAAGERERLLARLAELEAEKAERDAADEGQEEPPPYESWSVDQLDAELKLRQLEGGGKKQDKVDRLYADDAAQA